MLFDTRLYERPSSRGYSDWEVDVSGWEPDSEPPTAGSEEYGSNKFEYSDSDVRE
jgi:hypothetical protein